MCENCLFGRFFLDDEITSGKFDSLVVTINKVRGAGEFDSGVMMPDGECDFFSKKSGVRRDDGGADDVTVFVG